MRDVLILNFALYIESVSEIKAVFHSIVLPCRASRNEIGSHCVVSIEQL